MPEPVLIDGRMIAKLQEVSLRHLVRTIPGGVGLAIIQYGEHAPSKKYVEKKTETGRSLGISVLPLQFSSDFPIDGIITKIDYLNRGKAVHGIVVQHPIPEKYRHLEQELFDCITPEKDVDGLTSHNQGRLFTGQKGFQSSTARGIMRLLDLYVSLQGKYVTVVGASNIVGKPLSMLLTNAGSSVTLLHGCSREEDIKESCRFADVIVSCCGVPYRIRESYVREGAVLIDAGYNNGVGDIHPECHAKSSFYTVVPNGIGPVTVITLLEQTVSAAMRTLR